MTKAGRYVVKSDGQYVAEYGGFGKHEGGYVDDINLALWYKNREAAERRARRERTWGAENVTVEEVLCPCGSSIRD